MPRLSMWREGQHSADYKFFDNSIREMFTAGCVGINIHKFLGAPTGVSGEDKIDKTLPIFNNLSTSNIQDLLFLENRERKYDLDVYNIRGHYVVQEFDLVLTQLGLAENPGIISVTFHTNDMIERFGRKIIAGDVLEMPHLREFFPVDPNNTIPATLKKFYVVEEGKRPAEGFSPTWWSHLWKVKLTPMVNSQEYKDIIDAQGPLSDLLSNYNQTIAINDEIIAQAEIDVPLSGYDASGLYMLPKDELGNIMVNEGYTADGAVITADNDQVTADETNISPLRDYTGYLVGDGLAPNGWPVRALTEYPMAPTEGEYVLRTDFRPNRLFRFNGNRWIFVEKIDRGPLTGNDKQNLLGTFVNNTNQTKKKGGGFQDEKVSLASLLRPKAD